MMEDLDTDTKLALLMSIFESSDSAELLNALASCDGNVEDAIVILSTSSSSKTARTESSPTAKSPLGLKWNTTAETKRKNDPVLELHTASQIEAILPCTLITNILPVDLAKGLLQKMLKEAESWTQGYFKLFDRTVTSPHVANFYMKTEEDIKGHGEYVYNGQSITNIRPFTSEMSEAHQLIESKTRDWLRQKGFQDQSWSSNVAFSNMYDGRDSAVGYHSDQLSFIGPLPTIASLSLGCEREFRLKPTSNASPTSRTISIRLPHNSLFIMGPGCQEDFKHSIHPVPSTKGLDRHPIAGTKRINITYRNYRDDFAPSKLPRCKCNQQAVLRSAKPETGTAGGKLWNGRRYFWHCDGDKRPGSEGCNFFQWAEFRADGAPVLTKGA